MQTSRWFRAYTVDQDPEILGEKLYVYAARKWSGVSLKTQADGRDVQRKAYYGSVEIEYGDPYNVGVEVIDWQFTPEAGVFLLEATSPPGPGEERTPIYHPEKAVSKLPVDVELTTPTPHNADLWEFAVELDASPEDVQILLSEGEVGTVADLEGRHETVIDVPEYAIEEISFDVPTKQGEAASVTLRTSMDISLPADETARERCLESLEETVLGTSEGD